jgi:PPOX class probable F420-dependent enzyme
VADELPDWAQQRLADARVGRLATAGAGAEPHVIPVVFALLNSAFYIVIDEKPKSGRRLLRLRNIEATGRAALLVDHYEDDWERLWYILARGRARVLTVDDSVHTPALAALRNKYPQYRAMHLETAEMIELLPERWSAWRAAADG